MSIGTFGPVVFETSADLVRTWETFQRSGSVRIATHEVMEQKPRLEFLGTGLEEVSLQIGLSVTMGLNPLKEIDALRDIRDKGEAQQLVIGGENLGTFALVSMEEDWRVTDNAGRLLSANVSLKLKEYVEKKP